MVFNRDIEIVGLPSRGGEVKVVQLLFDDNPVMLCGYKYHSQILEDYLLLKNVSYKTKTIRDFFEEVDIPLEEGERYKVMGMGLWSIFPTPKIFSLPYGESQAYRIPTSYKFREGLREKFKSWHLTG